MGGRVGPRDRTDAGLAAGTVNWRSLRGVLAVREVVNWTLAARLLLLGCAGVVASVCSKAEEPAPELAALAVRPARVHGAGAGVAQAWAEAVDAEPSLTGASGPEAAPVDIGVEQPFPGVLRLHVVVEAAEGPLEATVELERSTGEILWEEDLPMLMRRGVGILVAARALRRQGDRAARRLLRGTDPELVLLALEWASVHRRPALADVIRARLSDPDPRVVAAALEAMAGIGTESDVPAMVAAARLSDREATVRLYESLGAIGGIQAIGFLDFAARNEDDPDLANLAQASATKARRRPAPPAPPTPLARGHRLPK